MTQSWALIFPRNSRLVDFLAHLAQTTAKDYFANRDTVKEPLLSIWREM